MTHFFALLDKVVAQCQFGSNHLICSSVLDLVVFVISRLVCEARRRKQVVVGRSFAVCLLEIPTGNVCVAQWMYRHNVTVSAIVLFIGDFHTCMIGITESESVPGH